MNHWRTSVSELIEIFKGALLALAPWLDRAKIPITTENAYDDYDEISSVLFRQIVQATVEDALDGYENLADYGIHLENYKSHSFLQASFPSSGQEPMSFVGFEFDKQHNILAKIALLNEDLSVKKYEKRECEAMSLVLARNQKGEIREIHEIKIEI